MCVHVCSACVCVKDVGKGREGQRPGQYCPISLSSYISRHGGPRKYFCMICSSASCDMNVFAYRRGWSMGR